MKSRFIFKKIDFLFFICFICFYIITNYTNHIMVKFLCPAKIDTCKNTDYISDKIFFCNISGYHFIKSNNLIKKGEVIIKEYPNINLFGDIEIDKGLQIIRKYIETDEKELYPRDYNYKKTEMIKNVHKIIKNNSKLSVFFSNYTKEKIELYYAKYIYNSFDGFNYGPLTLPKTAKLNHSCSPNVEFIFDKHTGQMTTIAKRDILKNEELYISYLTNKKIPNHKEYLLEHYGFCCEC